MDEVYKRLYSRIWEAGEEARALLSVLERNHAADVTSTAPAAARNAARGHLQMLAVKDLYTHLRAAETTAAALRLLPMDMEDVEE